MSYRREQQGPVAAVEGNKLVELDDIRLPFEFLRWYNTNYNNSRIISVLPQDRSQVFVAGASNKAIFQLATAAHVCISFPESIFTFKARIKNSAGTEFLKSDAAAATYCSITPLSSGALIQGSSGSSQSNVSLLYVRNSNLFFSQIDVKDMSSGQVIDQQLNPGLYAQLVSGGQDMLFWDKAHGQYKKYLCGVNKFRDFTWYYAKPASTGTNMVPSRLIPVLNGDIAPAGSSAVFGDVQEQQMYMWASTAGGTDGGEIWTCPFSDYLDNNAMCYSQYNKHSIEFTMNTYAGAVTDVTNKLTSTVAAGTWGPGNGAGTNPSAGASFEIYDFKLRLKKYYITNECVARFQQLANGPGIEIPFLKTWSLNSTFFNTQNQITITINDPRITDLQKVALIIRDVNDTGQNASYDKVMFRNMSTIYLDNASGGTSSAAGLAATAAQNMAVGQGYNGLWRVSGRYAQEAIPVEDYIYMAPYKFDMVKQFAGETFETQNGENNLQEYSFDGLDPGTTNASSGAVSSGFYHNCQSQFFIGLDLRTLKGAERSGLNIAKSPLDITLETKSAHQNTDDSFQVDVYLMVGTALNIRAGGVSLLS